MLLRAGQQTWRRDTTGRMLGRAALAALRAEGRTACFWASIILVM